MEVTTYLMWEHSSWGNSIFWIDWDKRKVSGFLPNIPKKGDILQCKMESGKIAQFKFELVEVMNDPKDQFFALVSDLDYKTN